jgi:hypothetical protein
MDWSEVSGERCACVFFCRNSTLELVYAILQIACLEEMYRELGDGCSLPRKNDPSNYIELRCRYYLEKLIGSPELRY